MSCKAGVRGCAVAALHGESVAILVSRLHISVEQTHVVEGEVSDGARERATSEKSRLLSCAVTLDGVTLAVERAREVRYLHVWILSAELKVSGKFSIHLEALICNRGKVVILVNGGDDAVCLICVESEHIGKAHSRCGFRNAHGSLCVFAAACGA